MQFQIILFGLDKMLRYTATKYPAFRERLGERNFTAQIMAKDEEAGRTFTFSNGKVSSKAGLHGKSDIVLAFKNAKLAAKLLRPPINWLDQINAQKDFKISVEGPDDLTNWFAQTIMMSQSIRWTWGTKTSDGVTEVSLWMSKSSTPLRSNCVRSLSRDRILISRSGSSRAS